MSDRESTRLPAKLRPSVKKSDRNPYCARRQGDVAGRGGPRSFLNAFAPSGLASLPRPAGEIAAREVPAPQPALRLRNNDARDSSQSIQDSAGIGQAMK